MKWSDTVIVALTSGVATGIGTLVVLKLSEWYTSYSERRINKSPYFKELHHVSLSVNDRDEAVVFYSSVFKLTQIERPGVFPFPGAWFALPGGKQLHLVENKLDVKRQMSGYRIEGDKKVLDVNVHKKIFEEDPKPIINSHFALRVKTKKDYDEIKMALKQRGLELSDNNFDRLEQLYVLDPSGNIIEITYFDNNSMMRSRPYRPISK